MRKRLRYQQPRYYPKVEGGVPLGPKMGVRQFGTTFLPFHIEDKILKLFRHKLLFGINMEFIVSEINAFLSIFQVFENGSNLKKIF